MTLIERAHLLRASTPPTAPRFDYRREDDRGELAPEDDLRCLFPGFEDDQEVR